MEECWLNRMMFLSLAAVLFGDCNSHFFPTGELNFHEHKLNCKKKKNSLLIFSGALGTFGAFERKQIGFIRTSHMRIYVVI